MTHVVLRGFELYRIVLCEGLPVAAEPGQAVHSDSQPICFGARDR